MDDLFRQLTEYARGLWLRRWIGLAVAWGLALAGAVVISRMPPLYEASARVFVDTASVLRPLMSGLAVQLDTDQQISMLGKTLISRPNLERVVQMADLDLKAKTPADREKLIEDLSKALKIGSATRDARDNLYLLTYRDSNPDEAKRIVQALLSIFVESSLGDKKKDTDVARRFIDEQIKQYEKRLEEAEGRVKDFKLRNMSLTGGGEGRNYFARMSALGEELAKARLDLRATEQARDALKKEVAGETAIFLPDPSSSLPGGGPANAALPELDTRLDTLRKQLDELQRRYTEAHPDVLGTKRIITELEAQRKQELAARKKAADEIVRDPARPQSAERNPVVQQLKVALAESEATVASLRGRVAELDSRYNELRASAQKLPQVETELAQLNRDYDVHKKNYESLVSRRESATLSSDMDATGVAEFKVIDPPRVSQEPVAPNRLILLAGALAASLIGGLLASLAMSQAAPTFHEGRQLAEGLKLPVLGSVSLIIRPELMRKRRRGLWLFVTGLGGLFAIYGAAMLILLIAAKPI